MSYLQKIPESDEISRPETGPMQFGDDWPGVFIRGDNAGYYAYNLDQGIEIIKKAIGDGDNWFLLPVLMGLRDTLVRSHARNHYLQVTEEEE